MIRLWLARGTATPIQEQLANQFVLGILSRRLMPGEKLPSVRELARRLKIHPNTVSAVYQTLANDGWISHRRGSGVFVRPDRSSEMEAGVDAFAQRCFQQGVARGYSPEILRRAFGKCANRKEENFLVVDPDPELARVLAAEISDATGRSVQFAGYRGPAFCLDGAYSILLTERFARTNPELLRTSTIRVIQLKSMQDILQGHEAPRMPILLSVVSRSEAILQWAKTLLAALGFSPDSLLFRNPRDQGWRDGLQACHVTAADIISARELSGHPNLVEFRTISREFLEQVGPAPVNEDLTWRHSADGQGTS